jgi:NADPH2:quinone reductase
MRIEEAEVPEPGPGEVRVRLHAIGVNFIDIYERTGAYAAELPFTPGREAAGVVEAVGPDTDTVAVGDCVAYAGVRGAYAERTIAPASKLVPVPSSLELEMAAAVMLQGMTAHYLSRDTYRLGPGDTALVHAAAGGVGLLLVQLAHRVGATVIGTVSTAEKATLAAEAGADHVVRYTEEDFLEAVRRITGGRGVDVVYDSVGRDTFGRSLDCLRPRGTLALYGQSSGSVEPFDPQVLNQKGSLFLTRPSLRHHVADREELAARAENLFAWLESGELRVRVDRTFPLADAAEAHRYMADRKTRGKILLVP